MPRHGANICAKCKQWGTTLHGNADLSVITATCNNCGHKWRTRSRYAHRHLLAERLPAKAKRR